MSSLLTLVSVSGLLDLAIKSAAVMLLAVVVAPLLNRASAAWRHLVWCLSVACLLLLPALSLALPAWRVAWLPQWTTVPTQLAATRQPDPAHAGRTRPLDDQPRAVVVLPPVATPSVPERRKLPPAAIETAGPPRSPIPWLAIAWGAGGLLSLVPLAVGLWQLAAVHGRSRVIGEPRWLDLLDELQRQLAVRRSVQLRQCEAALAPLTWGALWPVLLVPAEASAWTDERRRVVLLHELAHVRRWDWLTQLLAHVACAMYWFNPLVWLAARQMRIERERACDDLVLASGTRASDYAQELLALAAGLSHSQVSTLVGVPMARRGVLEDRLRGILDSRRSRAALTTAAVCLGAAFAVAVIAPLAMLQAAPPVSAASEREKPKKEPPLKEKPGMDEPTKPADKPARRPADKPAKPAATTITVRGKVVDDDTGEPIGKLVVQAGRFDPADPKKVGWGGVETRSERRDGSFSATVRWSEGWTARILADGYIPQPVLDAAPPRGQDQFHVTIRMKRGPKVRGVVLDHTGKPVQDAAVFEMGPLGLNLAAGQAWSNAGGINKEAQPVRTDAQGRFELPTGEAKSLAVSHASFDAWPAAIPADGDVTIRLPEPARVEVELSIDGAGKESTIFYQLLTGYMPEMLGVQCSRAVTIANPGKLTLAGMPPGKYQLCRRGTNGLGQIGIGAMLDRQYFELKAGETKSIRYVRDKGSRVRGKITWPEGTRLTGIVVSILSLETAEHPFGGQVWQVQYAAQIANADGTFLTEKIMPGKYLLNAAGHTPQTPSARLGLHDVAPSHYAAVHIEVKDDGELTVPDLALKPIRKGEP